MNLIEGSHRKSQFRIGSVHGRVNYPPHDTNQSGASLTSQPSSKITNYAQDEQVFHYNDVPKHARLAKNLVNTAITASHATGGNYTIVKSRELPRYISTSETANYQISGDKYCVLGSVLTDQPQLSSYGVVKDFVFTSNSAPAWVGQDDKMRAQMARDKIIDGKREKASRERSETIAAVRNGPQRDWRLSTTIDGPHRTLKGRKYEASTHLSVVEREREHMDRLRRERDHYEREQKKQARAELVASLTQAGRHEEAARVESGWEGNLKAPAEELYTRDALTDYLATLEKRRDDQLSEPSQTKSINAQERLLKKGTVVVGSAPFLKTLNQSAKYIKPRPVSTYNQTNVPLYRKVEYPDD